MGRSWRVVVLAVMALAVASPAWAVTLRYSPKQGTKLLYNLSLTGRVMMQYPPEVASSMPAGMDSMTMSMTMAMTQTAEKVDEDTITWLIETGASKMTMKMGTEPEETQDTPPSQSRVKMTRLGKVLEVKVLGEQSALPGMEEMSGLMDSLPTMFPEKEVNPGDSWTSVIDLPLPGMDESIHITMQSTLKRMAVLRGHQVAEIETKLSGPFSFTMEQAQISGALTGTLTTYHDFEKGITVETRGPLQMRMEMSGAGAMQMTQAMVLNLQMQLLE